MRTLTRVALLAVLPGGLPSCGARGRVGCPHRLFPAAPRRFQQPARPPRALLPVVQCRGGADGSPPPLLPFPFGTSASEVLPGRLWSQCVALGLACPRRTKQHFQGFLAPGRGEERTAVRVCRETSGLYLGLPPLSSATPRETWGTRYRKPLAGHAGRAARGSEGLAAPRAGLAPCRRWSAAEPWPPARGKELLCFPGEVRGIIFR